MRLQGFSNVGVSGGWKRSRFLPGGSEPSLWAVPVRQGVLGRAPGLMAFEISAHPLLASALAPGAEILAPLAVTGNRLATPAEHAAGACLPPVLRDLTGAEVMRDPRSLSQGPGLRGNPFATVVEKPGVSRFQHETPVKTDSSDPADRQASTLKARIALPDDLELKSTTSLQWLIVACAERAQRVSSDRTKTQAGLKSAVFPKLIDPC